MKKFLTAIATATLIATTLGAANDASAANKTPVLFASLGKTQTANGWIDVLQEGTVKKGHKVAAINRSPIARKLVVYDRSVKPGTIVIDNSERRLYHVISKGVAMVYGIAVGRDGFRWTGVEQVSAKTEWPSWTPPQEMREREAKRGHMLPERMEGGIKNPLGARALYLGHTEYRIHGTNKPSSIGKAASSGCIRMANEDVEHLYSMVKVGATVIIQE